MKRIITLLFCLSLLTTVAFADSIQDGSSGAIMKPHNELDGLNEGDYQHLTVLEKDVAINGSDTLDFTAKTVTVVDSVTVGAPELTISGDGLGNVTAAAASLTFNADVEFTGNVLGLPAVITNHNDLSGLNEGDYQHLTQSELLELQGLDTNYVATSSLVTTLLDYVTTTDLSTTLSDYVTSSGLTTILGDYVQTTALGDMAYENTTDYVATSAYAADMADKMDTDGSNAVGIEFFTADEKSVAINGSSTVDFLAEDITAGSVTVINSIDVGSTPDTSIYGDGAGTLEIDATTTEITGDLTMTGNGAITNINNFGVTNYVVVNSSNVVTSGSLRAGLIYSLGSNLSEGTISSLKGLEMWFGSAGGGSSVISNAQGLILKPIAMGATTVTSMTALDILPYSGGTEYGTAYGLRSQLAFTSGKTTYNLYVDGTAPNYIKGDTTVDGDVILTPKSAPSASATGAIYYDSDDNHFYGYNGTSWVQLDN